MKILFVFISVLLLDLAHVRQAVSQETKLGWYKQESGTQEDLRRVQFFSPTNGWICGIFGNAYRTTDGGEHWALFMPPPLFEYFYFMNDSTGFAFGPSGDTVYAIIMSTDRGQTWSDPFLYPTIEGLPEDMTHIGDTVWLLNARDVHRSSDGGKTWTTNFYTKIAYPSAIAFANSRDGFVVGDHAAFAYTDNGGESWATKPTGVSTSIDLQDIEVLPNKRLFVVGSERTLLFSDNDGSSWESIPKLDQQKLVYQAVDFTGDVNGTVVGSRGFIYRTTDGGAQWAQQQNGIDSWLYSVDFVDSLKGWTVSGAGIILHTSDAGKSWVRQYLPDFESLQSSVSPQPFATKTTITYELPKTVRVTVRIYDGLGKELQTISEPGVKDAGLHSVEFDSRAFSNEVFYYRIEAYPYVGTGKFSKVPF